MTKRLSAKELKAMVDKEMQQAKDNRERTGTGNPFPPAQPGEFVGMGVIRLRVADVDPYEDNPRQTPNEKFLEIKESIRARGLDQSLVVTKRPGAQRYILAKGGKTRLRALKELAQEDPKFEAIDFQHVHYQSESELLVAHMVENVQHNPMNFWDTANGFLLLRAKRSKELQRTVSDSEFASELKALGFKVDRREFGEYEFLHNTLRPLFELARTLGPHEVRNFLRPQFSSLQEISGRLGVADKPAFEQNYKGWLEAFVELHAKDSSQVEEGSTAAAFEPSGLTRHIAHSAAEFLGLTEAELTAAQAALSKDRKIDAAGLRAAMAAATAQQDTTSSGTGDEGTTTVTTTGGHADTAWTSGTGTNDADGTGEEDFGAGGDEGGTVTTADTTDADSTGGADSYRPPAPGGSARVPDGLSGVTPVPKSLVHTLIPLDKNGKPINQDSATTAGETPQGVQGTLPGTTSLEQAIEAFRDAVEALVHFAGIQDLVVPARTPMTFYMEAPQRPLGDDAADYAVLAWWFLANFTGQLSQEVFSLTVEEDGQTVLALPDTGPNGWRQIVGDNERLQQFAASHLGGVALIDGCHIINLMTDPHSSMAELALEVVRTAAVWRMHRGY